MTASAAELVTTYAARLGPADAGELLTLQLAAWVTEARQADTVRIPPLLEGLPDVAAQLGDPAQTIWGYRESGRLLATVRTSIRRPGVAFLARLGVVPDRVGEGLGGAMLALAEARLPADVARIELVTGIRSVGNLGFYAHAGYRITTHDYGVGIVHLAKDRTPAKDR